MSTAISNASDAPKTGKPKRQRKQNKKDANLSYSALIEEHHDTAVARTAIRVAAVGLFGFITWAIVTPIHELAVGQGQILPAGFVQNVQHVEGGTVEQILVSEGQFVEAGTPILQFDDVSIRAELAKAETRLEFIRLAILRQNLISSGAEEQWGADQQSRFEALRASQISASLADENYRNAQVGVIASEEQMKLAEVNSLEIRIANSKIELSLIESKLRDYDAALASGAVSRRERDEVFREMLRLESEIATLEGQIELARASTLSIGARRDELLARFEQDAVNQVAELEVQRAETEELVTQLQARLKDTLVLASTSGRINNLGATNAGQVIAPGALVAEIVPEDGTVFAEVNVNPDQIGFISEGMEANVKVLTYDFARFGGLEGSIVDVSPTSIMNPEGQYQYRVRVALAQPYVGDPAEGRTVTPGMSVTADIRLGDKSVMSYLLKPLRALSDRAFSER